MKLAKSLLLGSAATLVVIAGASAADLPSKKAAPVNYVKVCDAYGAGFFNIPGTDTCVKLGGRVRADYAFSGTSDIFSAGTYNSSGAKVNTVSSRSGTQNIWGWEARGRIDVDARTPTSWGTVQAVASLRLARTSGILENNAQGKDADGTANTLNIASASPSLEAAYIRFAGFTFGAARDNFAFMPSTFHGTGHWGSFANGAKQLAYTAVLGGGFSATLALQDYNDTAIKPVDAAAGALYYTYRQLPQIVARLDFEQAWGSISVMGATTNVQLVDKDSPSLFSESKQVWAIGAGAKINLPALAAGDALWLTANYADGMTEYTTNWTSFKSTDVKRNVGGFQMNHPSVVAYDSGTGNPDRIETVKSWNIAAVFHHFLTPQHRLGFLGSYGQLDAPTTAKASAWNGKEFFGDATVWNLGAQYTWLPVRNFEIGVDVLYARVEQDVRRTDYSGGGTTVTSESSGNWTGRLRVERTF